MGRGASDLTASALAKTLAADACEIYTDVTGVFTADPRIVPQARKLAKVHFDEMLEMAGAGFQGVGTAFGRVRPQPQRSPPRTVQLHLGTWHVGQQRGALDGRPDHLGCRHRHHRGKGDGARCTRPPRRVGAPVRTARRCQHQCRHDRPERVDARADRHQLHDADRRPGGRRGHRQAGRRRRPGEGRHPRRRHRQGLAGRAPA